MSSTLRAPVATSAQLGLKVTRGLCGSRRKDCWSALFPKCSYPGDILVTLLPHQSFLSGDKCLMPPPQTLHGAMWVQACLPCSQVAPLDGPTPPWGVVSLASTLGVGSGR